MYSLDSISRVLILIMGLLLPSSSRISNANAFQPLPTSTVVYSLSSARKLRSSSKILASGSYDDSLSGKSASSRNSHEGGESESVRGSQSHRRNDKRYPTTNLQKHSSLRMNQPEDGRFFQTLQHQNQRQQQGRRRPQSSLQAKPNGRSSSRGEESATISSNRNRRRRKSPTARIQLLRPVRIIHHRRHDEYGEPRDNSGTAMSMRSSSSTGGQGQGQVGDITSNYHQRYESYINKNKNSSRTPTRLQISSGLTFLDELGDQLLVSTQKPLGIVLEERGGGEGGTSGGSDGNGGAPAGPASKMISENQNLNINRISNNNHNNNDNNNMGCIVSQVVQGGNADRAGVQVGDYLVAVQNVDVEMASFEEVMDRIASAPKVVNLRFWRRNDDE